MSYRNIRLWVWIAIIIITASIFTFSQIPQIESMGGGGGEGAFQAGEKNRICQTDYLQRVRGILTGPSVDPTDGYLTTPDVLKRINAVANSCEWSENTENEKKYANFKKKLSGDAKNPKLLNELLTAIS
jgi:hypothetical protein